MWFTRHCLVKSMFEFFTLPLRVVGQSVSSTVVNSIAMFICANALVLWALAHYLASPSRSIRVVVIANRQWREVAICVHRTHLEEFQHHLVRWVAFRVSGGRCPC